MKITKHTNIIIKQALITFTLVLCLSLINCGGAPEEAPAEKKAESKVSKSVKKVKPLPEHEIERSEHDIQRAKYLDALEKNPQDVSAYYGLAELFSKKGDYNTALRYLNEAKALAPDDIKIIVKLGDTFSSMEKLPESNKYYNTAIKINPKSYAAYYGLANNNYKKKNYKAAFKLLNVIINYSTDDDEKKAAEELKAKVIKESDVKLESDAKRK